MHTVVAQASNTPSTLPAWLRAQAGLRGPAVALRYKRRGIWHPRTWRELEQEVRALAAVLAAHGFQPGDALVTLTHPRPQAASTALAAQWLGGVVIPLDPAQEESTLEKLIEHFAAAFAFAEGEEEVGLLRRVRDGASAPALLVYADARGVVESQGPQLLSYGEALARGAAAPAVGEPLAIAGQPAFVFWRSDGAADREGPIVHQVTHADLLELGRQVVEAERLDDGHEAHVSRAFASSAHARYVLAPWLIAGLRLNFPESVATRDFDRRELSPTMVVGTAETYGRLQGRVVENLPPPGTPSRRLVDWALGPGAGLAWRWLGEALVRRPLRQVIGFSRVSVPLVVGSPLRPPARELFSRLGIAPRAWPDPADFRPSGELAEAGRSPSPWRPSSVLPAGAIVAAARGAVP